MNHLVMFHGTCSVALEGILENGFAAAPPVRLSALMMPDEASHTTSFDGTYATVDLDGARSYAEIASEKMGGEPVIVTFRIPIEELVPDEDEVVYDLGHPLLSVLGFDEADHDDDAGTHPPLSHITPEKALDVVRSMNFQVPERRQAEVAMHLHDLIVMVAGEGWDGDFRLFHPDHVPNQQGFASPNWIRHLTSRPGGHRHYRDCMDRLTRSLVGVDPDSYPAGLDSCKGRVLEVTQDATGPVVVAIGSLTEWTSIMDATHHLDGSETWDWGSQRELTVQAPKLRAFA